MHEAKSGNLCVKITYQDRSIYTRWGYGGTSEFFVTTNPWAMERLERRLEQIGAVLPGIPFDVPVNVPGTFEIVKTKDGKYDRILSVKRTSEESPADEESVGFGDEPDTSFNFGFNAKPNSPGDIGF